VSGSNLPSRRQVLLSGAGAALVAGLPGWTASAAPSSTGTVEGGRVLTSLNGTWDFLPSTGTPAFPPPSSGWATIPVPAEWNMTAGNFDTSWDAYDLFETPADWDKVDTAWYRRTVKVPAGKRGERVVLRFEAVNFESTVYWNGQQVAHHLEGLLPFEADVTEYVEFGADNTVHVLVRSPGSGAHSSDGYHYPCGSWWGQTCAGIWQDVWLLTRPAVSVDDTAVTTSVRNSAFSAATTVRNDGTAAATCWVEHTVWDGPRQVQRTGEQISVPAGGTAAVEAAKAWKDARLWSPEDPHLYELRVDIRDSAKGPVRDSKVVRFGFREVWTDGPRLLLNGKPLMLRGDAWHYMGSVQNSRGYAAQWMRMAKDAGVNYMRLHAMPYPPVYYDVADETGMLLVGESGIYGSSGNYAMKSQDFWDNCATHLTARTRRDRNHPSVIAWSAENEMLAAFGQSYSQQVAAFKPVVLAEDTTRPVYFEGDQDPEGAGDFRSTHYPLEITSGNTAIPESARAFAPGGSRGDDWDRKKPFLIGEFSSMYYANPSDVSALGGPDAYADLDGLWGAHALTLRAQIEGFRYAGITGISPWNTVWYGMRPLPFDGTSTPAHDPGTSGPRLRRVGAYASTLNPGFQHGLPEWQPNPIHDAVARVFKPQAAYPLDYRTHFWGGSTLTRQLAVYNDDGADAAFTVTWSVAAKGAKSRSGHASVTVPAAGHGAVTATLALPSVKKVTAATWHITVDHGRKRVFSDSSAITLHPKAAGGTVPASVRAAVVEPSGPGATSAALGKLGATTRVLADLAELPDPGAEILVFAEGDTTEVSADDGKRIAEFAEAGGQVLVLARSSLANLLPWPLFTAGAAQTVTHLCAPHHPALDGIGKDDLRWWATDSEHVVETVVLKPQFGALRPLAVSGTALTGSALADARYGKGGFLLCQYPVVGAADAEPVAAKLLGNLLGHLGSAEAAAPRRMGVLAAESSDVRTTLKAAAADFTGLTAVDADALAGLDLLLVDAAAGDNPPLASFASNASAVADWVRAGGTLWINGAVPDSLSDVAAVLPSGARLTAVDTGHQHGAVVTGKSALTDGITHADLDWAPSGAPLVSYALDASGGTAAATTRAVDWGAFSSGTEQTKYARAVNSTLGFTPGAALWQGGLGSGSVVVDQLQWATKSGLPAQVGLASLIAAGLGAGFLGGTGSGELPTDGWKGTTNPATGNPANAFDRNPSTRWSSDALQQPGMFYTLDLGATHKITRLIWDSSQSSGDVPVGITFEVSTDGSTWKSVLTLPDTHPYTNGGVLTLAFDAVDARQLKITDTGSSAGTYMSVHELHVYAEPN
jgi:beta-galactosidase